MWLFDAKIFCTFPRLSLTYISFDTLEMCNMSAHFALECWHEWRIWEISNFTGIQNSLLRCFSQFYLPFCNFRRDPNCPESKDSSGECNWALVHCKQTIWEDGKRETVFVLGVWEWNYNLHPIQDLDDRCYVFLKMPATSSPNRFQKRWFLDL